MIVSSERSRYALVGTGHRAEMFVDAILGPHRDVARLVAMCDVNPARLDYYRDHCRELAGGDDLPVTYSGDEFDEMLARERPDALIVATVDATHADFVCAALDRGIDVICEKPLTTDLAGCRRIAGSVASSPAQLRISFNYRYSPRNSAMREVIASGAIGDVTSIDFQWLLDTVHGADYFRRWHRDKQQSGGLLVHKASHHFDLVSWWLDDEPDTVFALGALRFYGDANAVSRGLGPRPDRSHGAPGAADDPFAIDLAADPRLRRLYLDAERYDGYIRDADVFAPGITIEDNLAVVARYRSRAMLTYSLNAHSPWEGYRVAVNGTLGRAELEVVERGELTSDGAGAVLGKPPVDPSAARHGVAGDDGDEAAGTSSPDAASPRPRGARLLVQRHWEPAREVAISQGSGAHGGGDDLMLRDLFRPDRPADPLNRLAGPMDGLRSVLIGLAANESIESGVPVAVHGLGVPVAS